MNDAESPELNSESVNPYRSPKSASTAGDQKFEPANARRAVRLTAALAFVGVLWGLATLEEYPYLSAHALASVGFYGMLLGGILKNHRWPSEQGRLIIALNGLCALAAVVAVAYETTRILLFRGSSTGYTEIPTWLELLGLCVALTIALSVTTAHWMLLSALREKMPLNSQE